MAQVGLHCGQQHRQSVAVGGAVGELSGHHELRGFVHRRVRVVAVVITPHRARFMIRLSVSVKLSWALFLGTPKSRL